jgi:hypothetical protein
MMTFAMFVCTILKNVDVNIIFLLLIYFDSYDYRERKKNLDYNHQREESKPTYNKDNKQRKKVYLFNQTRIVTSLELNQIKLQQ